MSDQAGIRKASQPPHILLELASEGDVDQSLNRKAHKLMSLGQMFYVTQAAFL